MNELHQWPKEATTDDLLGAYIENVLKGEVPENPFMESLALMRDGRIMKININISHTWLTEVPPDMLAAMRKVEEKPL